MFKMSFIVIDDSTTQSNELSTESHGKCFLLNKRLSNDPQSVLMLSLGFFHAGILVNI